MQQHTGQHVLSQAFWELLKGETLSFHMGPDVSTLEIGLKTISDSDCDRVEDRANAVVWQNREVKTYFVPEERIAEVPLRRPPKKQGLLRVVEVDGFDYSACGGTHVRRTGEIGLIKLGGIEKIRGNLRFDFLCGGRALRDYRAEDRAVRKLAAAFSCPPAEIAGQVEKLAGRVEGLQEAGPPAQRASGRLRVARGHPHGGRAASSPASSRTGPRRKPVFWPWPSSSEAISPWPTARPARARVT